MQRVRIGLTGLAGVFLLVLVAAAFFGLARHEPNARRAGATSAAGVANDSVAEAPKEPLAELGVTPGNLPAADTPPSAAASPSAAAPAPR